MDDAMFDRGGSRRQARGAIVAAIFHGACWALVLLALAVMAPGRLRVYQDFGLPIPGLTWLVVKGSNALGQMVPFIILVLATGVVADAWFALHLRREPGSGRADWLWFALMTVLPLATLAVALFALFVSPFLDVDRGLRAG